MVEDTFPKLLLKNARRFGDKKVAMREKYLGIWQEYTWKEYYEHVKWFSLGLRELGFKRGDKLAIIGDNRPEWVFSELAAQSLGGISVGLYQDSILKEVAYIINHSDATFVVAEDQEQVDKILEIKSETPQVKKVIYYDPKGMRNYRDNLLLYFYDVLEMGREVDEKDPNLFDRLVEEGKGSDIAIISYTSGTTGFPKGSMLTFNNMINMAVNLMKVDPRSEDEEYLSFLPMAWMGEQMMTISSALIACFTVNFPEEPETVQENIREIGPHVIFSPPRIWENLCATVQVKIMDATWLKRKVYNIFMPVGYKMADYKFSKEKPPLYMKILYKLAYILLFRALKDRLGFCRIKHAYTGGAALGPDTFRFFHALGINLKQIYGQTEIAGISCLHRDDDIDFNTVGKPIPGTEIKISENGEILSRSNSVFAGYYKNEEATKETLKDGWLHSGDAGYIDEKGHLVVIDRLKDLMELADGTKFSPQFIENKLKFSPYIKEAMVVGKGRPYITAIINIDYGIVGKWAEDRLISYTTYTDLASKDQVYDLIEAEVNRVNKDLPEKARIRKFILLYKELDADDDELTRTRKLRRRFIGEKYKKIIESLYQDVKNIDVEATIKYQDGRTQDIRTTLKIREV